MKDALAEELLARVVNWTPADIARERPLLQAMASLKYDTYEQFSPGMRYVESLALWLNQFEQTDRSTAYEFIKSRLVFFSADEINHFVATAYPDQIRNLILEEVASEHSMNPRHIGALAKTMAFRLRQRQCLFLGLSDGARIDCFRRANTDLNHEQICQTHELSESRVNDLLAKLSEHLEKIDSSRAKGTQSHFRTIVLMDDFSASGSSYYMKKTDGTIGGKIAQFRNSILDKSSPLNRLVTANEYDVIVLLYIATEQAIAHLNEHSKALWSPQGVDCKVEVVQQIPSNLRIVKGVGNSFEALIEKYYDHGVWDPHLAKGGTTDAKYGYAACGLPIVLYHNTPNNSLALFWSYEGRSVRGLFPRVQRHREIA